MPRVRLAGNSESVVNDQSASWKLKVLSLQEENTQMSCLAMANPGTAPCLSTV